MTPATYALQVSPMNAVPPMNAEAASITSWRCGSPSCSRTKTAWAQWNRFSAMCEYDACVGFSGIRRNGIAGIASGYLREEPGRTQDGGYAVPREPVVAADLLALKRVVSRDESLAQRVAPVEDHGQAPVDVTQPETQAEQHQRRGHRSAFVSGVPDSAGHSGAEPDEPVLIRRRQLSDAAHDRRCAVPHSEEIAESAGGTHVSVPSRDCADAPASDRAVECAPPRSRYPV